MTRLAPVNPLAFVALLVMVNVSCAAAAFRESSFRRSRSIFETPTQLPVHELPHDELELNDICTNQHSLSYLGFDISRSYDQQRKTSQVSIQRGKRLWAPIINRRDAVGIRSSCFGLYPVLGAKRKQLVVVQTSGGAHCCFFYRIYDFTPRLRLIFDSSKYRIGDGFDELEFRDLDHDGVMEFTQQVVTFDYCCDLAYVSSPQPTVAFRYNSRVGAFLPDVRRFKQILLRGVAGDVKQFESDPLSNWPSLLRTVMQNIYVGQERKAWRLWARGGRKFDRAFEKLAGKKPSKSDPTKPEIKKLMRQDPIYRLIYHQR